MKHSKGTWIENPLAKGNIIAKETERPIASCMGYSSNVNPDKVIEENLANAKLITEAGTVTNETGYTPRQLAEQKAELLKACEKMKKELPKAVSIGGDSKYLKLLDAWQDITNAIEKATE